MKGYLNTRRAYQRHRLNPRSYDPCLSSKSQNFWGTGLQGGIADYDNNHRASPRGR